MTDSNLFSGPLQDCCNLVVHSTARGEALRAREEAGLVSGFLHPSLHYSSPEQIRLWQEVHRCHAPSSFLEFYRMFFQQLAEIPVLPERFHLVALGAASAVKELLLLQELELAWRGKRVEGGVACDLGFELALGASQALQRGVGVEVRAVAVAWDQVPWSSLLPPERGPALVTAFGVMPNLLPEEAARCLAEPLQKGDVLVASAHLTPWRGDDGKTPLQALERIEPQYDNAETLAWLRRWLVERDLEQDYPKITCARTEVSGVPAFVFTAARAPAGNPELPGTLRMFHSLRPTPVMMDIWAESCGLKCLSRAIHPSGEEGLWCWQRG